MPTHRRFSGTQLKRFACLIMLIDHIGASCLELGFGIPYVSIENLSSITTISSDPTTQNLILLNAILRAIGHLAFPIFSFFLVEGFLHTKNAKHYLLRLVSFAFISELFFDFAFFGTFYYPALQNIFTTFALALLCLMLLQTMENAVQHSNPFKRHGVVLGCVLGVAILILIAQIFQTDYAGTGVLLIIAIYLVRNSKVMQNTAIVVLTMEQLPAPLAVIPLAFYNGERGACSNRERWAFYIFYPAHIAVLGFITNFILL